MLEVNFDAFSDGQMASKIWLCEELEKRWSNQPPLTLWIFGSWYGLTALALLIRQRLPIREVHLFDIDEKAQEVAKKVLNRWTFHHPLAHFHTADCLTLAGNEDFFRDSGPGLLINTSCEHFPGTSWIKCIPDGSWLALQSTNKPHQGPLFKPANLEHFKKTWDPAIKILNAEELFFEYPLQQFHRYLILGKK